jgi:hypothetical protein
MHRKKGRWGKKKGRREGERERDRRKGGGEQGNLFSVLLC